MAMAKFRHGDRVVNKHNAKGTVQKVEGKTVHVKLDGGLETTFDQDDLKFHYDLNEEKRIDSKHVGEKCPRCGTPWSVDYFTKGPVYHCKPCNKKAADLLVYQPPKMPWDKKDEEDLLKEFEKMLDDGGLDDWDIFMKKTTLAQRVELAQYLLTKGSIVSAEDYIEFINKIY